MKAAALLIATVAFCAPAFADDSTPAPAPTNDLDKMVCHHGEPITGSRLPGPEECRTQREWNQLHHDSQDVTNALQTRALLNNPKGS